MLKKKIHHDDSGETFVKKENDRLSCVTHGADLDNGRAMAKANKKKADSKIISERAGYQIAV